MDNKAQIVAMLKEQFSSWEELLAGLSEEQITAPQLAANWSVKDVMAHLMAWQQHTIARLEGTLHKREPKWPPSPAGLDLEAEDDVQQINAWIYETHRRQPWSRVYRDWRAGFMRYMELTEAMPEQDLLEAGRYPWQQEYPLSANVLGSCEHHQEHLGWLRDWLREHTNAKPAT